MRKGNKMDAPVLNPYDPQGDEEEEQVEEVMVSSPETPASQNNEEQHPRLRERESSENDAKDWVKTELDDVMASATTPPSVPASSASPPIQQQIQQAFMKIVKVDKPGEVPVRDIIIKVPPQEPSHLLLDSAEQALHEAGFNVRRIHREQFRLVLEIGQRPLTLDLGLTRDLERCVLIKVVEPVPEKLIPTLHDCYGRLHRNTDEKISEASEIEFHEEPVDGPSVRNLLDADYVVMLTKEMKARSERELMTFAVPLEKRAKDDEIRVRRLEKLLTPKYSACHLPVPVCESAPPLCSFPLDSVGQKAMLKLRSNPSPREVDAQLKMALQKNLENESLARQERKKKECFVRAEVCERNRNQLVSILSNSQAALSADLELMERLGINPPQVALCRVGTVYGGKPGFLVVTRQFIVFEPVGMFGFRLGSIVKLDAKKCRSVMKGRSNIGFTDSLCILTDNHDEHSFYFPTIDDVNEQMDMVFELIWQILRMNRWTPEDGSNNAVESTIPPDGVVTV